MTKPARSLAIRLPSGVGSALLAAVLFGAGTPLAKVLLAGVGPWMLAALLYLGSGLGLAVLRRARPTPSARLERSEWPWLVGAVGAGGVAGPVLLMFGLSGMPAAGASLLLNAEGVFTALLAWFAFKENFDRRIALGMLAIVAGAVVLSWPGEARFGAAWPSLAILGACLAWGVDNNLTRKVSLADATWVAMVKGLAAGSVNLASARRSNVLRGPASCFARARHLGTPRTIFGRCSDALPHRGGSVAPAEPGSFPSTRSCASLRPSGCSSAGPGSSGSSARHPRAFGVCAASAYSTGSGARHTGRACRDRFGRLGALASMARQCSWNAPLQ